ncbi:MAG: hypothetical protein DCF31_02065 [Alphaproteobacteria bacterium]|nr:MAG: hypothetical protein DCF31_02065 [Alphaproteobacteria bacterium]
MSIPDWDCGDDPAKQRAFKDFVIRELERIEEASISDPKGAQLLTEIVADTAARAQQVMTRREFLAEQRAGAALEKRGRGRPPLADQGVRHMMPTEMAARDVERMRGNSLFASGYPVVAVPP